MVKLNTQNVSIMKNLKIKYAFAFFLIVFGLSNIANAQHHKFGPHEDGMAKKDHHERNMNIPDLSDEQKEKIKGMMVESRKKIQPIENELGEKGAKLHTLSTSESPERKALESLTKEIGSLQTEILLIRTLHKQDVRSILNEEQRLVFDSHNGPDRHNGRRGNLHEK
jgi:Spy/CpxP family protein refolding chaperone